jgi:hypothetical protein
MWFLMGNNSKPKADYNVAMGRLVVVAAVGCLLVLVYGLSYAHKDLGGHSARIAWD